MLKRIKYIAKNWKLMVHLLFRTYRFGVNNNWKSDFDSMFGLPIRKRFSIFQLIQNYKCARFRACECYFITEENAKLLFSKYCKRKEKYDR